MTDKDIEFVKQNYRHVAEIYRNQKDATQSHIPLFQTWLSQVTEILELGCASGFPIGKAILESGKNYTGIDLSPDQIKLAQTEFPQWADHFIVSEMLEYVKSCHDTTFDGIVRMFSIRHLPRIYHVELYSNIYRVLSDGGLFLVDHPKYSDEGRDTWFNDKPMYWSGFSDTWQKLTLMELGFTLLDEFEDVKIFNDEEERTLFALYRKKK